MNNKPNYYSVLPAKIRYDKNLTSDEKILYSEITALSLANGECWATNGYFAELYGVSKETISRRISKLEGLGYIKSWVKKGENNNQIIKRIIKITDFSEVENKENNIDTLLTPASIPLDATVNTPIDATVNTLLTPASRRIIQDEYYKYEYKPPISPFDVFWQAYPKKIEKKKARQIFEKKIDEQKLVVILQDLEKRKKYEGWTKDKGKYIPHPTTYLNQERWEDEYETGSTSDKRSFMDIYKERYED